jgi:glycosyltransferase involved in cell wall biosynthesis
MDLLYVYPAWHTVSFTVVARKHVEYLKRLGGVRVHEADELGFTSYVPQLRYIAVIHPWMFIWHRLLAARREALIPELQGRFDEYMRWWRNRFEKLVGIDVCDSDALSNYAVQLLNEADRLIVPSSFAAEVYRRSGVKVDVVRVPHGVDPDWYYTTNVWETAPVRAVNPALLEAYLHKARRGRRVLLYWLWHSPDRKGWPEVRQLYERLARERRDVVLALKTMGPGSAEYQQVMHLGAIQIYGWLGDYDKMALYDLADLALNFSRGGGFELNCLEALARGVPCLAGGWGGWRDYVPSFLQVKAGERVQVLPGNAIHVGYGYKVDVEDALDKVHDVLENYDDYRARLEEYRREVLAREYRWDVVAERLLEAVRGGG